MYKKYISVFILLLFVGQAVCQAEDGSKLWLRSIRKSGKAKVRVSGHSKSKDSKTTLSIAQQELQKGWLGNQNITLNLSPDSPAHDGYTICVSGSNISVSSSSALGLLYGSYDLLRKQAGKALSAHGQWTSTPAFDLRMLNHWDNPDGTIERGYAGRSIFFADGNPALETGSHKDRINRATLIQYARANASVGINAIVINNVNAKPEMLSDSTCRRVADMANLLRPYGIRVWMSVNFASPKALGKCPTADPSDPSVRRWWAQTADKIYRLIPDFGGFLVKANSEGEPGPMDYGRSHAEGANMLARALRPHGGRVIWRAFVYNATGDDRAAQAYDEFMPQDGQFDDNVTIQVKNGPIDFQPREPISPLLLSMQHTHTAVEFQITQEYLGESIHQVFLAPMWKETLDLMNRYERLPRSFRQGSVIAGVSNIGNSTNWTGSDMAASNWYAFGRLAWNPQLSCDDLAREFLAQTFSSDTTFLQAMTPILAQSREAAVNYMMPMGLHHIFAGGHHYGPEPWCYHEGWREDWLPRYYHKATGEGIGFDRTITTGSGAVGQYPDSLRLLYNNKQTCPDNLILWFHHMAWDETIHTGETTWEALCHRYDYGVRMAETFARTWKAMRPYVDDARWTETDKRYQRGAKDAWWWRDGCLLYFQQFSKRPFPLDCPPVRHDLQSLMKFTLNMDNYSAADMNKLP